MAFEDKELQCVECGETFIFSADEQSFFESKGYTHDPKRCPSCREKRKVQRMNSDGYQPRRQMFQVICAACGKETEVPFEPHEGRPVYCSDCYSKIKQNS